ncbi:hatching enzyme 1.2-like [Musca vetustissima]|uniref:hatching enzyme 1.2-like n=1 Tax=Musca vetustissima TaxID=27455 RepID=UPI002AB7BA1A|nr:hatching enzyme 1.2-like [Musca vetustissima]
MFKLTPVLLSLVLVVSYIKASPILKQLNDDEDTVEISANTLEAPPKSKDVIDLSFYGTALFGKPDHKDTAELVANYKMENSSVNPEELGSYLEGDILVPTDGVTTKNGLTTQSSRWPNAVVPYEIRGNFNGQDMAIIEHAIAEYHRRTCIRFVPRTSEQDYISIVSGNSGCWSSVGRVGGKQEVNLQSPGCLTKPGTAMHELMHALGFLHEQNREERDAFVSIQFQNIQPSAKSNFDRASHTMAFGVPYDYGSVMHYSSTAFSTNGQPTIIAMQPMGDARMGQRDGFSDKDIEKLNRMYDCPASGNVGGGQSSTAGNSAVDNALINSFVSGIMTGLGFGDNSVA